MPPGPPGDHLGDALSAFLDDELAPAARREAEAHLAGCPGCQGELEEVAAARRAIRIMPVHATRRPLWGDEMIGAVPGVPGGFGIGAAGASWPHPGPERSAASRRRRAAWALVALAAAIVALLLPRDPSVAPSLPSLADTHAARASITEDPLSQLAPIAVPVRFGP